MNQAEAAANPVIPVGWEITVTAMGLLIVLLTVIAVVSLARDRSRTPTERLAWLLIVLALPVLGSVLWLGVGRRPGTRAASKDTRLQQAERHPGAGRD